jgi:hypothetical protein
MVNSNRLISIVTTFIPSNVYACSCAQPLTVEAEFSRSEAVFVGRVLEVKEQTNLNGSMTKAALFEVSHIWKGGLRSNECISSSARGFSYFR